MQETITNQEKSLRLAMNEADSDKVISGSANLLE